MFLRICWRFKSAKKRSANHKSANCHICERSANLTNLESSQVCGFAICWNIHIGGPPTIDCYRIYHLETHSPQRSHTTHYLRKLGNTQQTEKLFVIPNLVLHCILAFLIIVVYCRESLNNIPSLDVITAISKPVSVKNKYYMMTNVDSRWCY